MPADTPFAPQEPYDLSDEERNIITGTLSSEMSPEKMKSEIEDIEKRAGWTVQTSPKFKIVREALHAAQIAEAFQAAGLRMNAGGSDWPDFWMRLDDEEVPCELTTVHNPDQGEHWIPMDKDGDGNFTIDMKKDYSDWPEDQFFKLTPHAGQWRNKTSKAFRNGQEAPLGDWPQLEILRGFPVWAEREVLKKNEKAKGGNYVEETVLVIVAEFRIMVQIPHDLVDRLIVAMRLGTAFRAVIIHVPDRMMLVWGNPEFRPFTWQPKYVPNDDTLSRQI